jgi:hypothetical protein
MLMKQGIGPKDPKTEGIMVAGEADGADIAEVVGIRRRRGSGKTNSGHRGGQGRSKKIRGIDIHNKRRQAKKVNRL